MDKYKDKDLNITIVEKNFIEYSSDLSQVYINNRGLSAPTTFTYNGVTYNTGITGNIYQYHQINENIIGPIMIALGYNYDNYAMSPKDDVYFYPPWLLTLLKTSIISDSYYIKRYTEWISRYYPKSNHIVINVTFTNDPIYTPAWLPHWIEKVVRETFDPISGIEWNFKNTYEYVYMDGVPNIVEPVNKTTSPLTIFLIILAILLIIFIVFINIFVPVPAPAPVPVPIHPFLLIPYRGTDR